MNVPARHSALPITLPLIEQQPASSSRLRDILAAPSRLRTLSDWITDACELFTPKPAWTAPTFEIVPAPAVKCKHGLREAWCAACANLSRSGQSKQRVSRSLRFQGMRRTDIGTHDGDTIGKVSVMRIEAGVCLIGLDDVDDFLADEKAEAARENRVKRLAKEAAQGKIFTFPDGSPKTERANETDRRFSRCLGCGKPFTARSRFEFCGETEKKNGECKRTWLEKHQPLCVSRIEPNFNTVTREDILWAEKQASFPHSRSMPRTLKNYCVSCIEQVTNGNSVLRETKGMYLPIEHKCGKWKVDGVPVVTKQIAVVRPREFPSEDAAQEHFESKLVTFVGDGAELEVIDSFKYNPRANHSAQREKDLMRWAERSQVGVVVGPTCVRCTTPIGKRKGTKYCSDNCRKRHHEATQGEN